VITPRAFLRLLSCSLAGLFALAGCGLVHALEPATPELPSALERVVDALNSRLHELDAERHTLGERLRELPTLSFGLRGEPIGYHTRFFDDPEAPHTVLVDLGREQAVDLVALVPVSAVFQGETIAGYGFPRRFRVETARERSFADASTVFASDDDDVMSPGSYPLVWRFPERLARYVRITVTRQWQRSDGRYLTALGELAVLRANRIVSVGAHVTGRRIESFPTWSIHNLIDGQTDLGLPVSREASVTNGFRSDVSPSPYTRKWIELDLGRERPLDAVHLIPAHPIDAPNRHAHGFPTRFRVLAYPEDRQAPPRPLADFSQSPFPNPGDNPVIVPAAGHRARYVRIEAEELRAVSGGGRTYALALSELQVYSEGRNLAPAGSITASDVITGSARLAEVWSPAFLIDGFSSQNRLIEPDAWLLGLDERRRIESRIAALAGAQRRDRARTTTLLVGTTVGLLALVAIAVPVSIYRRRRELAAQRAALRVRIARDLHDDIGSRLGGMRLISEALIHEPNLPPAAREDVGFMHRAIREALDAMRDIVWLLDRHQGTARELVAHMRQVATDTLGHVAVRFETDGETPDAPLEMELRRHVLFAFKEALANCAKHAQAHNVSCRVTCTDRTLRFTVADDGRGFDRSANCGGHGLNNLAQRAAAVAGTVRIESAPGRGTTVDFAASLPGGKDRRS
jgi:signal transduction histidine kinase